MLFQGFCVRKNWINRGVDKLQLTRITDCVPSSFITLERPSMRSSTFGLRAFVDEIELSQHSQGSVALWIDVICRLQYLLMLTSTFAGTTASMTVLGFSIYSRTIFFTTSISRFVVSPGEVFVKIPGTSITLRCSWCGPSISMRKTSLEKVCFCPEVSPTCMNLEAQSVDRIAEPKSTHLYHDVHENRGIQRFDSGPSPNVRHGFYVLHRDRCRELFEERCIAYSTF